MQDPRARGRRTLLIVAAVFFVPVIAAFALYYGEVWRPAGSSSKGELITPARPLEIAGLRNPDGTPAAPGVLADKWTLIYIGDGACDADCRAALVYGRQSRLALNNEMTRVQRVFLATGNCCAHDYFAAEQPGLLVLDASAAAALLGEFPADRSRSLFIVDPLGNLMMRHDAGVANQTSKDLLTDLKKLLKLSHIG
ncbi:MAG: cytochrome oxidase assembly protein [Pseudomonadota bacterium]